MSILRTIKDKLIPKSLKTFYHRLMNKLIPGRVTSVRHFSVYSKLVKGKSGIEIGGPSAVFNKELPIYPLIAKLDGCNFSGTTVWEGTIHEGNNYNYYAGKTGYQYICEASNLAGVKDEQYDFLLASHCLEHCANVLKTVKEWLRVIKKGGGILLVLPARDNNFDHNRPITSFEHLLEDYKNNIDETDLTHMEQILELHDLSRDIPAGTKEQFRVRSQNNFENRCLHHHVFDIELLKKIYSYFDITILATIPSPDQHIIVGVKK